MKWGKTLLALFALLVVLISSTAIETTPFSNTDIPSPFDRVQESQIYVYNDRVVIYIENAQWSTFSDTNSMDPVIDQGTNAIQVVPESHTDIHVGDIISYESDYVKGTIIHRVTETGFDSTGWYAKVKGDNLNDEDPGNIRFEQIKRVVVAIIY